MLQTVIAPWGADPSRIRSDIFNGDGLSFAGSGRAWSSGGFLEIDTQ
jgi:hypothetical protein